MALREKGPNGAPAFEDPAIPFVQLSALVITFDRSAAVEVHSIQNDCSWSLAIEDSRAEITEEPYEAGSIYRTRVLPELPLGIIQGVDVAVDEDGDLSEVRLHIEGRTVSLAAGEVYEENDGSLRIVRPDESVLVSVE